MKAVLQHRAVALLMALAFLVLCAALAATLRFLHDEGVFSYDFAAALPHALWPILFFVKAKALIMLLYALPAQAGLPVFLVAHAAAATGAVLLSVAAARRLGLPSPNLAGWALATSLGFCVAAASGFANSDGALFLALFLWLYASERRLWAALVLGALPLVRYELAFTSAVFVAFDVWRRRDARFVLALLALPLSYLLAGAVYHADPLWLVHTFPNGVQPGQIRRYQSPHLLDFGRFVLASLLVNFSALGVLGLVAWDRRDRRLTPLFIAGAGTLLLLLALPLLDRWFAVDRSLRYHVAPLPLVAVLAASWRPRSARGELGVSLVVAAQALGLALMLAVSDHGREQHLRDHRLMAAVRASPLWRGQVVYTDLQIARYDRCAGVDASALANQSMVYELDGMLARNGEQRRALLAALAQQRLLFAPGPPRRDALYVLDASERGRYLRDWVEAAGPTSLPLERYTLYGWPP